MEDTVDDESDAPESTAREFTPEEKEALRWGSALARVRQSDLAKLGHQDSRRGKQRAVALLLGHASPRGEIEVWSLRRTLDRLGIMNEANYAQDMKKDSTDPSGREYDGLWSVHTFRRGRRLAGKWILTERGKALGAEYAAIIDRATAQVVDAVERTFKLTPKAARCGFCLDTITDDNKAQCQCGSVVHATCLDEFARGSLRCALANTTAACRGQYKIIAKPTKVAAPVDVSELETVTVLKLDIVLALALAALDITTTEELREAYFPVHATEGVELGRQLGRLGSKANLALIAQALQDDANRQAAPLPTPTPRRERFSINLRPASTTPVADAVIGSPVGEPRD